MDEVEDYILVYMIKGAINQDLRISRIVEKIIGELRKVWYYKETSTMSIRVVEVLKFGK